MKQKAFLIFSMTVILFASCRKEPNYDELSDNFIVSTNIDTSANFSSYGTYYISDTVAYVNTGNTNDSLLLPTDPVAQQLVATVKNNMNARGYTFVNKDQHPDLGLNMGVVKNTSAGVVYPGWWWSFPGWWDPWYWDWWYPYYYPWTVAYVVTEGTIIIDMIDLKNASKDSKISVIWNANMGGALGSDPATNMQNGVDAINQAFKQSPTVKKP